MFWYISRDSKFVLGPISFWQCKWASRWRKLNWVAGCCVTRQLRTWCWLQMIAPNWIHARNTCRPTLESWIIEIHSVQHSGQSPPGAASRAYSETPPTSQEMRTSVSRELLLWWLHAVCDRACVPRDRTVLKVEQKLSMLITWPETDSLSLIIMPVCE